MISQMSVRSKLSSRRSFRSFRNLGKKCNRAWVYPGTKKKKNNTHSEFTQQDEMPYCCQRFIVSLTHFSLTSRMRRMLEKRVFLSRMVRFSLSSRDSMKWSVRTRRERKYDTSDVKTSNMLWTQRTKTSAFNNGHGHEAAPHASVSSPVV